jgi:beta-glucosidase
MISGFFGIMSTSRTVTRLYSPSEPLPRVHIVASLQGKQTKGNPMERIESLLSQMSLEEKVAMVSGADMWRTVPNERLGIPEFKMTDGPNGARGDAVSGASAVSMPVGTALASTWNVELIENVGKVLGEETKSKAAEILLGPTINIHRTPLGGRNFECYSEDPYLTGRMAVAFTRGVQSQGVGVCLKHYICNDSEFERHTMSSDVDERSLREIYLAPFESGIKEAGAWSVMSSYNRINDIHAPSHTELLIDILKDEWGFDGAVISDWGGTQDAIDNAKGGLDLEMPGPGRFFGEALVTAVKEDKVQESVVDDKVRRLLRILVKSGRLDNPKTDRTEQSKDRPEHRQIARRAARESMVLLKNNGTLPLSKDKIKSIAVIGPNAETGQIQGGGSSGVKPHYQVHPLQGIREALGKETSVSYEVGCLTHKYAPAFPRGTVEAPDLGGSGFKMEQFSGKSFTGEPIEVKIQRGNKVHFFGAFANVSRGGEFSVRLTSNFTPAISGSYNFGLMSAGLARLYIDGEELIDNWTDQIPGVSFYGNGSTEKLKAMTLEAGVTYEVRIEFQKTPTSFFPAVQFGVVPPLPSDSIERAAKAAAEADAAVLVIGTNSDWETEGNDRVDMSLPGDQQDLVEAVLKANPQTIIVVNAGAPVEMPWLDRAPAVLYSWFGGQEYGNALADLIFGDHSPSGKLTTTFPKNIEDTPAFTNYPGENGHVQYGENLFVGYRWYDKRKIEPLRPFGFGLSYTTFDYSNLEVSASIARGEPMMVSFDLTNSGSVEAQETAQVYVQDVESSLSRPMKELKAFDKVSLAPGETRRVTLALDERALSFWDPRVKSFVAEPGTFKISVGASATDIRLEGTSELTV